MVTKIVKTDFADDKGLREHSQRSRDVARALDAQIGRLPHSSLIDGEESEERLEQSMSDRRAEQPSAGVPPGHTRA